MQNAASPLENLTYRIYFLINDIKMYDIKKFFIKWYFLQLYMFFQGNRIVHTCGMCEEICKIENLKSHSWKITTILLMKILYIFIEY